MSDPKDQPDDRPGERAVSAARQPDDAAEASLRPQTLADFKIGRAAGRERVLIPV
jgi:hypothetical protein